MNAVPVQILKIRFADGKVSNEHRVLRLVDLSWLYRYITFVAAKTRLEVTLQWGANDSVILETVDELVVDPE